jgi:hypothetical protein
MEDGPDRCAKAASAAELCAIAGVASLTEFADVYLANIDLDVSLQDSSEVDAWPPDHDPGVELVLWLVGGYGTWVPYPVSINDIVDTALEKEIEVIAVDVPDPADETRE